MRQIIAIDTETFLIGPYRQCPKIVCVSYSTTEKSDLLTRENGGREFFEYALRGAVGDNFLLVGHNMAFDMACVMATWPDLQDLVWSAYDSDGITCTETRERLLNIATGEFAFFDDDEDTDVVRKSSYSLSSVHARYFGSSLEKGSDTWRLRYGELDSVALDEWPQAARDYALLDADATLLVYQAQEARKKMISYSTPTEFFEARAALALQLMKSWGVTTNKTKVAALWNSTIDLMDGMVAELSASGLLSKKKPTAAPISGRVIPEVTQSMARTRELVVASYPDTVPRTEKGQISTAKNVIEDCNHPLLTSLVEFKRLQKSASTYISKMFDDIIHPGFIGLGACSTRTSCREPNAQNQPTLKGIRECYEPRPGYVYLDADFDSQEMRMLAQTCIDLFGQSKLAAMYQQDRHYDPHLDFAASIMGISIGEAKDLLLAGDKTAKAMRQRAKVANFGFPGGMSSNTLVTYAKQWGVILTPQESRMLRDRWFDFFPEVKRFLEYVGELNGVMTLPRGGVVRGGVGYTEGANGFFQGPGAHATKAALWEVSKRCYTKPDSFLYGSRPVLEIHDEILLETPIEAGHWAAIELEGVMIRAMEEWTPDVPSSASATLMMCWSKQAEQIWENGRMAPWRE